MSSLHRSDAFLRVGLVDKQDYYCPYIDDDNYHSVRSDPQLTGDADLWGTVLPMEEPDYLQSDWTRASAITKHGRCYMRQMWYPQIHMLVRYLLPVSPAHSRKEGGWIGPIYSSDGHTMSRVPLFSGSLHAVIEHRSIART